MENFFDKKMKLIEDMSFENLELINADLQEARIMNSSFSGCLFKELNIEGVKFYPSSLFTDCTFVKLDFTRSTMISHEGKFIKCKFKNCKIKNLDFDFTRFENCVFENCVLEKINFNASSFSDCKISSKLKDVTFNGIYNTNQSNFETLVNVDFSDSDFGDYVTFNNCDLSTVTPPENTLFDKILYPVNSKDKTILSTGDVNKTVIDYSSEDFKKMFGSAN